MAVCRSCGAEAAERQAYCSSCGASLSETTPEASEATPDRIGAVLGSYRVLGVLGVGGMGTVYEAEHMRLGRRVALKMLHPFCRGEVAKRFFSEARTVNQIAHENIIEITDFVEGPEDSYYIMELLHGRDLRDLMQEESILPLARSLPIAIQAASALSAVHAAGVIHRDLKPANVFLIERSGVRDFVKLLDFGVAKSTRDDIDIAHTASGVILGTPQYMSPEQSRGDVVGPATDIYALGVILYHIVAGKPPYSARSFAEMIIKQNTIAPVAPSTHRHDIGPVLPAVLDELILQCLRKDPRERPESMQVIEETLRTVLEAIPSYVAAKRGDPSALFGDDSPTLAPEESEPVPGVPVTKLLEAPPVAPNARPGSSGPWVAAAGFALVVGVGMWLGLGPGTTELEKSSELAGGRPVAASEPARSFAREGLPHALADDVDVAPAGEPPAREPAAGEPDWALPPTIEVAFSSQPAGAEVFVGGDSESLGRTPFNHTFDRKGDSRVFEFRLPGYVAARRSVPMERNLHLDVSLARAPRPAPPSKPPALPDTTPSEGEIRDGKRHGAPPTDLRDPWAK